MLQKPAISHDPNSLWVTLNEFGDAGLFGLYPIILAELLIQDEDSEKREENIQNELENLVLPSDKDWRLKQYFQLVHIQRSFNENVKTTPLLQELEISFIGEELNKEPSNSTLVCAVSRADEEAEWWAFVDAGSDSKSQNGPTPVHVNSAIAVEWEPVEVAKAARLVQKPPLPVEFANEQEMRRVYALIYDVFRYKTVVNQALDNVGFFSIYPDEWPQRGLIWLFVVEMARGGWRERRRQDEGKGELDSNGDSFDRSLDCYPRGLKELDADTASSRASRTRARVWEQRVHFAAAFAKLRIKHNAFTLSDLLPPHLRDGRVTNALQKTAITGWVNFFKSRGVSELIQQLSVLGYTYSSARSLAPNEYRFDRVCPRFITIRPPCCDSFAKCPLVRDGIIVMQEREFCEGASMFISAVRRCALRGDVAQTHATSPRAIAYLAARLRELSESGRGGRPAHVRCPLAADVACVGTLFVFGLGNNAKEYECALRNLGVSVTRDSCTAREECAGEVCLIPEGVCGASLRGVVAALATPPNSYSAVADPVDLVCGRGGDLEMIEILTESELDSKVRNRVAAILEEQKKTLKFLMSKPQIQLILYETHSALDAENGAMTTRAVAEYNRLARLRHARVGRRHRPATAHAATASRHSVSSELAEVAEGTAAWEEAECTAAADTDNVESAESSRAGDVKCRVPREPDQECPQTEVPKCDLFEIKQLPSLGNGIDINAVLERDGCYLGLIQRKEVTRLDAKYMIRMAEERGLFGGVAAAEGTGAGVGANASVAVARKQRRARDQEQNKTRRFSKLEVDRISAPTYSSSLRSAPHRHEPHASTTDCRFQLYSPRSDTTAVECCERFVRRVAAAEAALRPCSIASCECGKGARRRTVISAPAKAHFATYSTESDPTAIRDQPNTMDTCPTNLRPATDSSYAVNKKSVVANNPAMATICRPSFPIKVHDVRFKINHDRSHCAEGISTFHQ